MQMNSQRSAGQLLGCGICEFNAPGKRGGLAVTAARRETSQSADGMAERQACYTSIQHRKDGHLLKICVKKHGEDRAGNAAVKSSAGLKSGYAHNFAGIGEVIIPGAENEPDFRENQRGEHGIYAHVPDFVGVKPRAESLAARPPQTKKHARG